MHSSLNYLNHRPWPLLQKKWTWRQSWCDLLFMHWPISKAKLQPLIPQKLKVQEFEGTSWIGVVPFRMQGVMRRPFPDLPWISAFPELNLRIYVEYENKPGVWFFSLDAANPLAVWAARKFFHLPYFWSEISLTKTKENEYLYQSFRKNKKAPLEFKAKYQPQSNPYQASPGTLEHWLTERYCLYTQDKKGNLLRAEVHHQPWPLQKASAQIFKNELLNPLNLSVDQKPTLLHFAKRIDVILWPLERC